MGGRNGVGGDARQREWEQDSDGYGKLESVVGGRNGEGGNAGQRD